MRNPYLKYIFLTLLSLSLTSPSFIDSYITELDSQIHNTISSIQDPSLQQSLLSKIDSLIYKTFNVFVIENSFTTFKENIYTTITSHMKSALTTSDINSINNSLSSLLPSSFWERLSLIQIDRIVNKIYLYLEDNGIITSISSSIKSSFTSEITPHVVSLHLSIADYILEDVTEDIKESYYNIFRNEITNAMLSYIETSISDIISSYMHLVIKNEVDILLTVGRNFSLVPLNLENIGVVPLKVQNIAFNPSFSIDLSEVKSKEVNFEIGKAYTFYLSHLKGFIRKCKSTITITNSNYYDNILHIYLPPYCVDYIITPFNSQNEYYVSFIYTVSIFGKEHSRLVRLMEAPITVIESSHLKPPFTSGFNENERTLDSDFVIESSYLDPFVLFEYRIDNQVTYTQMRITRYSNLSERILNIVGHSISFVIYDHKGNVIYAQDAYTLTAPSNTFQMKSSAYVLVAKPTSQQITFSFSNDTINHKVNIYEDHVKVATKQIGAIDVVYNVPSSKEGTVLYGAEYKGIYKDFFNVSISPVRNTALDDRDAEMNIPMLLYKTIKTIKNPYYEFDEVLAERIMDKVSQLWEQTYEDEVDAKIKEYLVDKFEGETFESLMQSLPDGIEEWINSGLSEAQKDFLQTTTEELFNATMIDTVIDELMQNILKPLTRFIVKEKIEDVIEDTFEDFSLGEQFLMRAGIDIAIQTFLEKKSLASAIKSTYSNVKNSIRDKVNDIQSIFALFSKPSSISLSYGYVHEKEITNLIPELTVSLGNEVSQLCALSTDKCTIGLVKKRGYDFIDGGVSYEGGDKTYTLRFNRNAIRYYVSWEANANEYYVAIQVEGLLQRKVYALRNLEVEVVSIYDEDYIKDSMFINFFMHNGKSYLYDSMKLKVFYGFNTVLKYNINGGEFYNVDLNDGNTQYPLPTYGDVVNAVVYRDREIVSLICNGTVIENIKVYASNNKYLYPYSKDSDTVVSVSIENYSEVYGSSVMPEVSLYVNGEKMDSMDNTLVFPKETKAFYIIEYEYRNLRRSAFVLFIGILNIKDADNINEITSLVIDMFSEWRDGTNSYSELPLGLNGNMLEVFRHFISNVTIEVDGTVNDNSYTTTDVENYVDNIVDKAFSDSSGIIEDKFKDFLTISISETLPENFLWNKMNEINEHSHSNTITSLIDGTMNTVLELMFPEYDENVSSTDKKEFTSMLRVHLHTISDKLFQSKIHSSLLSSIQTRTVKPTISTRVSQFIDALYDSFTATKIIDPMVNNIQVITPFNPRVSFEVPESWETTPPSFFENIGETQYYIALKPVTWFSSDVECEKKINNFGESRNVSTVFKPNCISLYTEYKVYVAVKKKVMSIFQYFKYYEISNAIVKSINPSSLETTPFSNAPSMTSSAKCVLPTHLTFNPSYDVDDVLFHAVTKSGTTVHYHTVPVNSTAYSVNLEEWVNKTSFVFYKNGDVIYAKKDCDVEGPIVRVNRKFFIVSYTQQKALFTFEGCDSSTKCKLFFCTDSFYTESCPEYQHYGGTMTFYVNASYAHIINVFMAYEARPQKELKIVLTVVQDIETLFTIQGVDVLCDEPDNSAAYTQSYRHVYYVKEKFNAEMTVTPAKAYSTVNVVWTVDNEIMQNGDTLMLGNGDTKVVRIYEERVSSYEIVEIRMRIVKVNVPARVGVQNGMFYMRYPCKVYKMSLDSEDGVSHVLKNEYDESKVEYMCIIKQEGEQLQYGKYSFKVNYADFGNIEVVDKVEYKDDDEYEYGGGYNDNDNDDNDDSGNITNINIYIFLVLIMLL